MKVILTEIELTNGTFTEKQLSVLHKYYASARFKTLDDFALNTYDNGYSEDKEKNIELQKIRFDEYLAKDTKELYGYSHSFTCDINLFLTDFPSLLFKIKGTKEVMVDVDKSDALKLQQKAIDEMVKNQQKRLESMMKSFVIMSQNIAENLKVETLNQKCDVHVGGGLLLTINETLLLEDACTDRLQTELNSGWRIIAVSVQADCRRPDYILGRFNPTLEIDGRAKR